MNEMKSSVTGLFSIYSQRIAGLLMLRGFTIVKLEENRRFSGKKVFVFANSEDFQKALKEVQDENK